MLHAPTRTLDYYCNITMVHNQEYTSLQTLSLFLGWGLGMRHTSFLLRAHYAHVQYFLKAVEEPIIQLLQEATYYSKNYS